MNNLHLIGEWLRQETNEVIRLWLNNRVIHTMFKKYRIDIKKFSTKFSKAIITHNIEVIQGKKEIKDCPVMNTFVDYMVKKDITSEDIFLICTKLRATIFEMLWKNYPNFSNDFISIKKIIHIFDKNLAGVLANFDKKNISYRLNNQKNIDLKNYVSRLQTVLDTQNNTIFKLHANTLFMANKAFLFLNGVTTIDDFKKQFSHPLAFIKEVNHSASLFQTKEYDKWIETIIRENDGHCKVELFDHVTNKTSLMQMSIAKIGDQSDFVFTLETIFDDKLMIEKEQKRLESQKSFLSMMEEYKENEKPLAITNYYLELAIKSDATILRVTNTEMSVGLRKISLFSLDRGDPVYIEMPQKPHFKATVKDIDRDKNRVVLSSFESVTSSPLDSKHVHVKLKDMIDVLVASEKHKIKAQLESASINTFILLSEHLADIGIDAKIRITAKLSKSEKVYTGVVYQITPIADAFKIVVHLDSTPSIEEELAPYVSSRQLEIIKELQKNII